MRALASDAGRAHVIGVTGAPGVGKSTTTNALVTRYRERGARVGVLAVDPSSPFSGGALLGDRIRMSEHAADPGVFIRSMASRGHLGGLSWAAPQALRVLDAAGCDVVLAVGVGQSEIEVAAAADTTLVLLAPGMGDSIQAAKAGILEIGDVFVVNKADRDGRVDGARAAHMLTLGSVRAGSADDPWRPPVLQDRGRPRGRGGGRGAVRASGWLERTGSSPRVGPAAAEIEAIAFGMLRARIGDLRGDQRLDVLADHVAQGLRRGTDTLVAGSRSSRRLGAAANAHGEGRGGLAGGVAWNSRCADDGQMPSARRSGPSLGRRPPTEPS
jgi:LAO/AO transport system kinase